MSTTETLTAASAGTWQLDPVHSSVAFEVAYLAGTFKGEFRETDARLTIEGESAALTGSAQVSSLEMKDENLTAHLQSPDFFDAERTPELLFSAEDIRLDGESVTVDGELTIRGVARSVVVEGRITEPITDGYGAERIGLELSTTVDRTEFGLSWNMPLPSGEPALANDVRVVAGLQFVKAA